MVQPMSTGITYSILDRSVTDKIPLVTIGYGRTDTSDGRVFPYAFPLITNYWNQTTVIIKYMGQKLGGMDKLKGKKIAHVYHDSAFGKEQSRCWRLWRTNTASSCCCCRGRRRAWIRRPSGCAGARKNRTSPC